MWDRALDEMLIDFYVRVKKTKKGNNKLNKIHGYLE